METTESRTPDTLPIVLEGDRRLVQFETLDIALPTVQGEVIFSVLGVMVPLPPLGPGRHLIKVWMGADLRLSLTDDYVMPSAQEAGLREEIRRNLGALKHMSTAAARFRRQDLEACEELLSLLPDINEASRHVVLGAVSTIVHGDDAKA